MLVDHDILRQEELAESLARDETVPQDDPTQIEIALHHHHLPMLSEELFIDYDSRSGDAVLWKDSDAATELLESS